jgi:4-hydroxy-3-methylbut-2-en-1-yl diphosphate reductase
MRKRLSGIVGVTAGASAPEELINEVIARLAPANGVEVVRVTDEDEYFPPPRELRDVIPAIGAVFAYGLGAPIPAANPIANDRSTAASDVLAQIRSDLA